MKHVNRIHLPLSPRLTHALLGYLAAVIGTGITTLVIGLLTTRPLIPNISMLYLIMIFAIATLFGTGPSVATSVLAFLAYDWFFVDPPYTFTISDPAEWLSLLLFLLAAVITGHLVGTERERREEALEREHEAVTLYEMARMIGAGKSVYQALPAVAERLCVELEAAAVSILLPDTNGDLKVRAFAGDQTDLTPEEESIAAWVLEHGQLQTVSTSDPSMRLLRLISEVNFLGHPHRVLIVPLLGAIKTEGVLRAVRPHVFGALPLDQDRLLTAIATQLALAIERDRLQAEASQAEILLKTDELRTALLNSVSHDFLTPLAGIKMAADSLLEEDIHWDHANRREFIMTIELETDRLNRLVSNLLDMSRIESGALRPAKELYPIGEVVRAVVQRLAWMTTNHHIRLNVPGDLPLVLLDYIEIDQVISNLLENAVRYTPYGTEILMSAHADDKELRVSVIDHGAGIPPSERTRIFDRFYRLNHRPNSRGTGLGLVVCKGLVQAHGGRIWIEETPGGGASFVFTLPLVEYAVPAETRPIAAVEP